MVFFNYSNIILLSPNKIREIKSRRMKCAGHVTSLKRRETHIAVW
jgi:hypothetical protein